MTQTNQSVNVPLSKKEILILLNSLNALVDLEKDTKDYRSLFMKLNMAKRY